MIRFSWLIPLFAGTLFTVLLIHGSTSVAPAWAQEDSGQVFTNDVVVSVSLSDVSTFTGDTFTFSSEIINRGSATTPIFIANLNFTSLDNAAYVDPEDWSPQRTQSVVPIEPGASATLSWSINPILEGDIAAYVVLLPDSAEITTVPLIASPAILLHVSAHKSLNPGGVLPVVIAVPGVLVFAFAGLRVSSKRWRS